MLFCFKSKDSNIFISPRFQRFQRERYAVFQIHTTAPQAVVVGGFFSDCAHAAIGKRGCHAECLENRLGYTTGLEGL